MTPRQPNQPELLETIQRGIVQILGKLDQHDARFDKQDARFDQNEARFDELVEVIGDFSHRVDERLEKLESDVGSLKSDVGSIKATMVTKEYLDEKLANVRGECVQRTRKGDEKTNMLVDELSKKKMLSAKAAKSVLILDPLTR